MGKKLDALLGRAFKPSKFKSLISLAISRLAVFKNQRQVRCNQARSDVVQLLELGHYDRALLRVRFDPSFWKYFFVFSVGLLSSFELNLGFFGQVEQVIKEQNMLDVFVMLEGYCNLVIERVHLIEQERLVSSIISLCSCQCFYILVFSFLITLSSVLLSEYALTSSMRQYLACSLHLQGVGIFPSFKRFVQFSCLTMAKNSLIVPLSCAIIVE